MCAQRVLSLEAEVKRLVAINRRLNEQSDEAETKSSSDLDEKNKFLEAQMAEVVSTNSVLEARAAELMQDNAELVAKLEAGGGTQNSPTDLTAITSDELLVLFPEL